MKNNIENNPFLYPMLIAIWGFIGITLAQSVQEIYMLGMITMVLVLFSLLIKYKTIGVKA